MGPFVLGACSPKVEPGDPVLPPGFEEALLPNVDLGGYVYAAPQAPFLIPTGYFRGNGGELTVERASVFLGDPTEAYGGVIRFASVADARAAALDGQSAAWKSRRGSDVQFVPAEDPWSQSLRSAVENGETRSLAQGYPELADLILLFPEEPPSAAIAAGFLRTHVVSLEALGTRANIGLGNITQALSSIRANNVAFVIYADVDVSRVPEKVDEEFFRDAGLGAVFVARSSLPGVAVSLGLNAASGSTGLERWTVGEHNVRYKRIQDFHLFIANVGSLLYAAMAPSREYAERLIAAALE